MALNLSNDVTAGNYAHNESMQIVAADDFTRVGKHKTCVYTCACGCGYRVHLRRGTTNRAHFAYAADHVATCKGSNGCAESEEHYDAKWLLQEKFDELCFWETCPGGHRTTSSKDCRTVWVATVEKIIPSSTFRADVLLENKSAGAVVALEVVHTNQVTLRKKRACDALGTRVFEVTVKGLNKALKSKQFGVENNIPSAGGSHDCDLCDILEQEVQKDKDDLEARRILDEDCRKQEQQKKIEQQRLAQLAHQHAVEEAVKEKVLNERRREEMNAEMALLAMRRREEAVLMHEHKKKVADENYAVDSKRRKIERCEEIIMMKLAACHSKYA